MHKLALRLRRTRREHNKPALTRCRDRGQPNRRLPNPRFALQHEPGRTLGRTIEERGNQVELRLAPDDVSYSNAVIVTPRGREVSSPSTYRGYPLRTGARTRGDSSPSEASNALDTSYWSWLSCWSMTHFGKGRRTWRTAVPSGKPRSAPMKGRS